MADEQIKYKFDNKTIIKICRGALIAATGSAALFVLDYLKMVNIGTLEPIAVMIVPTLINLIKEWMKGADK